MANGDRKAPISSLAARYRHCVGSGVISFAQKVVEIRDRFTFVDELYSPKFVCMPI
jgi:hypothetical protein